MAVNPLLNNWLGKNIVAGGLKLYGEVPGAPQRGVAKAAASNITNPAVNVYGRANPMPPDQWKSTSQAQPTPTNELGGLSGGLTGGSGGRAATLTPAQIDYYNKFYDTQVGHLQGQLGSLGQQRDVANLQLQQQYGNSQNALNVQKAQGMRNLDFSGNQLQGERMESLDDIARQLQQQSMSYNSQLGSIGAGNSSAQGLISQALAGQASRNRGDVIRNASTQQQQLDMQRADLEQNFNDQIGQLEQWKQSQVNDLMSRYNSQLQQLQAQIAGAQGERAQVLASQQPQLIQQAIDALGRLQSVYNQTSQDLVGQFQTAAKASFSLRPELQEFAVNPIDAGRVGGIPNGNPLQNQAFDPVSGMLRRRPEDELLPLGF